MTSFVGHSPFCSGRLEAHFTVWSLKVQRAASLPIHAYNNNATFCMLQLASNNNGTCTVSANYSAVLSQFLAL